MAAAATVSLVGVISGLLSGTRNMQPADNTSAAAVGKHEKITLSSGANTITPPSGATMVLIVPPVANAQNMTLKGVTGDTGIALAKTQWVLLSLQSVSSFVITAGGTITDVEFNWI